MMARESILNRRVQLRRSPSEDRNIDSDDDFDVRSESGDVDTNEKPQDSEDDVESAQSESEQEESSFRDISFGALAKAQETLGPRKRKLAKIDDDTADDRENDTNTRQERDGNIGQKKRTMITGRTSKHAPAVQSSKHAVSRRRDIFQSSPALKFRDPRFDPTVISANRGKNAADLISKNYSFLTAYQADEVLALKAQIKKSKDPEDAEKLKRQVMSIESKIRVAESRQRERDILKRHTDQEKEAIKTGQKSRPYYLKASEVKKISNTERLDAMGKRARDKAVERRRKREKGKDAKHMPRERRQR